MFVRLLCWLNIREHASLERAMKIRRLLARKLYDAGNCRVESIIFAAQNILSRMNWRAALADNYLSNTSDIAIRDFYSESLPC